MPHTPRFPRRPSLALLCACAAVLAGCASPARVDQMQVDTSMAQRAALSSSPFNGNLALKEVTGGRETNPAWVSNVSSSDLEAALEASLKAAGLAAPNRQAGRYVLTADMLKLDQPFAGASMTVTATIVYRVIERSTNKEVFVRTVAVPYTAPFNAAFLGSERLKLANEGAIRESIKQLIDLLTAHKLSAISLTPSAG
ncbi:MAG: hypothetical protein JNJ71_09055 [Rubrivivax sp.]|nr:hypothetical protein [Rubrivivax sp.]